MWKFPYLLKNNTAYKNPYIYLSFLEFEYNPTESDQTTVERLVEETCQSSENPVVSNKRKVKKMVLQVPTIQYSEKLLGEDPNTPSNQMGLDSGVDLISYKGKDGKNPQWNRIHTRKCHIPKASTIDAHNI
ncbi:hypothetical protein O181_089853 [Austropuccinia psidii MF-1]|uniref:Uncharacterized protein n=1 Tax=Austropuccinia psidii MF-1 TaxID=1389203 RepID=A0A9Q3IUA3_9BASI|nr:hypothetical protein [Austropuccinia psidii MF-1]